MVIPSDPPEVEWCTEPWWHDPRVRGLIAEVTQLREDYAIFEELSPPDIPRKEFVRWCFEAWEEKMAKQPPE